MLRCTCGAEYELSREPAELAALGLVECLSVHARNFRHGLSIDGAAGAELHTLHMRCLAGDEAEARFEVPWYLCGVAALAFHACHEGHAFEATYQGVTIRSPGHSR